MSTPQYGPGIEITGRITADYAQILTPAALAFVAHGLEFADALHLCSRPPGAPFVSFDQSFLRAAQRAGVPGISGVNARTPPQ